MAVFPEDLPESKNLGLPEMVNRTFREDNVYFDETYVFPTGDVATLEGRVIDGQVQYDLDAVLKFADNTTGEIRHLNELYQEPIEGKE